MSPDMVCTVQGVQGSVQGDQGTVQGVRGVPFGCAPSTKSWARGSRVEERCQRWPEPLSELKCVHNDNIGKYLIQKLLTGKYDQLREAEFSKQKKQNTMEACLMFQTSNGRSSQGV